jgi:hypothetical protein
MDGLTATKNTRNTEKRTCAIHAELPAIQVKPTTPAIMAIARRIDAHARIIEDCPL